MQNVCITFCIILMGLSLTTAKNCEAIVKRECQKILRNPCYFDRDRTCFKHFQSNCEMELAACNYKKVYEPWSELYCESLQFMCPEEIEVYNWPPDNFYDQIVHLRQTNQHQQKYEEGMFLTQTSLS